MSWGSNCLHEESVGKERDANLIDTFTTSAEIKQNSVYDMVTRTSLFEILLGQVWNT